MKKTYQVVTGVLIVLLIGFISAHFIAKNKIRGVLKKEEKKGLTYDDFRINLLMGSANMSSVAYPFDDNKIEAADIRISGLSYFDLLSKDEIRIKKISIEGPKTFLNQKEEKDESEDNSSGDSDLDKEITVEEVEIKNGSILIKENKLTILNLKEYDLNIRDIKVTKETLKNNIPFEYGEYNIQGKDLDYHLNQLQNILVADFSIEGDDAIFNKVHLAPNYSREEYVEVIPYEKDLMNMELEKLKLTGFQLNLAQDPQEFTASQVDMEDINLSIYRDKLVKDDPNDKKMYSRMLRELPIKLGIEKLNVRHANLSYEEVQEKTGKTGKVFFSDMNVEATDITNIGMEEKDFPTTSILINCQFMGEAPLETQWQFAVNNPSDEFTIKGSSKNIPPETLNSFFTPAFNMKAEGENISELEFDFSGDSETAGGIYKMVYEDFEVEVLDQEENESKLLSFLANIFVKKDNNSNKDPVEVSDVERDKKRSFWNYFWNCIFEGLKETVI